MPYIKVMDLKLNLSTEGIATSALDSAQVRVAEHTWQEADIFYSPHGAPFVA